MDEAAARRTLRPLTPGLLVGFGAILVVLIAALVVERINLRNVYDASEWVTHTQAVRAALREVLAAAVDAETGQRGFIIMGDESYLGPYTRSVGTLSTDIARARTLTADNPTQQGDLEQLQAAAALRFSLIAESIRLRRESGFAAAQAVVATGEGKRMMDEMRAIVARMEAREQALLGARIAEAARSYGNAQLISLVTTALSVLVLGLLFAGTRRFGVERRVAEQTAERLNVTLRSIGDGVITTDNQGRIHRMNPVAEALTGWSESEAAGRALEDALVMINEQSRLPVENPVTRVLREGAIVGLANHTILIGKSGREIPIDDSAAPIRDADGDMVGVVMVFRDISERHQAERDRMDLVEKEQLARRQAEVANRTKDEFLATVSHELRTPLNAILGWADMLRSGTLSDTRRERAIDAVYTNAVRQTKLIDELLDVSRIMSGKLPLDRAPLDLRAVVRSSVDVIQPSADAKHIDLAVDAGESIPEFYGDATRLQQILVNLLSNAIKFTSDGGSVRVGLRRNAGAIELTVSDSGQGIPARFLPLIFEPFRQADHLTTRQHGGLGLGLSIVRHLVEAHGGHVRADSAGAGKGSTFTVLLPVVHAWPGADRAERTQAQTATSDAMSTRLNGVVVLVVDDDDDNRDLLVVTLQDHGAAVLTASSAAQALDMLQRSSVDALLSDIAMPGEDGYSLIRRLRARETGETGFVPAAALTSLAREEDRLEALRAGFQLHLSKPIDAVSLVEAVRTLTGGTWAATSPASETRAQPPSTSS
jgi:PAS domain S-box-containing protein